jgi:hypothetical protein
MMCQPLVSNKQQLDSKMFAGLMFSKAGFNGAVRCSLLPTISRPPSLEIKTEVSIEDPHFSSQKRSNVLVFSGRRHVKRDLTHYQKRPDTIKRDPTVLSLCLLVDISPRQHRLSSSGHAGLRQKKPEVGAPAAVPGSALLRSARGCAQEYCNVQKTKKDFR